MDLLAVRLNIPEGANLILGQAHFIKTPEDLYEIVVNTVPGAKFAVAFCEASGPCLIRVESNDDELRQAAITNAQAVGAGHCFVLLVRQAYQSTCSAACGIVSRFVRSCAQPRIRWK